MLARLSALAAIPINFAAAEPAWSQPWPARPVTVIVPFAAGGATDTLARFLGKARLKAWPNIPTTDEAGLPGFVVTLWYGLWVPKDTPRDIIAKLNATMVQVLASPPVKQRFEELGIEISAPDRQTPDALRAFQKQEAERWWPIIKAANIKVE